ncbi:hypothetical protein, partial [Acinetobacter baumannii]|uniref:hypothetical protein n=1 Tax=Acinetobacter baumannii TaxID=470 RepID=UPI00148EF2E1
TAREKPDEYEAMIDEIESGHLPSSLRLLRSFGNISHGRVQVCMVNYSDSDVWLQPKTPVGQLYDVDEVDKSAMKTCSIQQISVDEIVIGEQFVS